MAADVYRDRKSRDMRGISLDIHSEHRILSAHASGSDTERVQLGVQVLSKFFEITRIRLLSAVLRSRGIFEFFTVLVL